MSLRTIVKSLVGPRNAKHLLDGSRVLKAQLLFLSGKRKKESFNGLFPEVVRKFGDSRHDTFFGYYDVTPFSPDNAHLLASKVSIVESRTSPGTLMRLGVYRLADPQPDFEEFGTTATWCWQQGCRLQWYPSRSGSLVLFNSLIGDSYGAVLFDWRARKEICRFQRPIYAIDASGRWALSLNFSRLQRLRPGYGYHNLPDSTERVTAPADDGIWRMDLASGKADLLFSVEKIARWNPRPGMESGPHYFNHLLFNPSGSRFFFFHIWGREKNRRLRMLTADLDGKNLYPLVDNAGISHASWKSDQDLVAYLISSPSKGGYFLLRDRSSTQTAVGGSFFGSDGHPTFSPNGEWILSDTYPDSERYQHLLLYHVQSAAGCIVGSFYAPLRNSGEQRCDLHPRWSPSGQHMSFDSAHDGKRSLYVVPIPSE